MICSTPSLPLLPLYPILLLLGDQEHDSLVWLDPLHLPASQILCLSRLEGQKTRGQARWFNPND